MANAPADRTVEEEPGTEIEAATRERSHTRVWDVGYDPDTASEYECLDCGELIIAESHPGNCPQCGSTPRNRSMPCE
jgi:rubrerythrin